MSEHEGMFAVCALLIGDIEKNITLELSADENDHVIFSRRALSKALDTQCTG